MAGPRRTKGSGSRGRPEGEDEPVDDPVNQPRTGDDRSFLSSRFTEDQNAKWWEHPDIVSLLILSIQDRYNEYSPNWKETSPARQNAMFNFFMAHVRTDLTRDAIRKQYESAVKPRLTKMVYRATEVATSKPDWIPECIYQQLLKRKEDKKWKKLSETTARNRASGGVDGKALGTHCFGRKSMSEIMDDLAGGSPNGEPSPYKLLEKGKKNKKGEWISPRAEKIHADYAARKAEFETGLVDENEEYLKASGGWNKGRVFGTGKMAQAIWKQPRHRSRPGDAPTIVPPGVMVRTARENVALKQKISDLESKQEWMLKMFEEHHGIVFPDETCSSGPTPHRRDEEPDDGDAHGFQDTIIPPVH